ncbi:PREDICTED: transcription factor HES-1 [Thamnophis sirtalis]|uniref:Transcription factor HES-1 n=1 Tax=Thamnophis sirtalis TaxID=35019 RepID=A0A6I9Z4G5_9SAUR|nr:PREDICTED: transcription factor HES-1 [Thamnophis sirtalis]
MGRKCQPLSLSGGVVVVVEEMDLTALAAAGAACPASLPARQAAQRPPASPLVVAAAAAGDLSARAPGQHLRAARRLEPTAALNTDPSVLCKYRAGFNECMTEVTRFLSSCEAVKTEVRNRLLGHLAGCLSQISALNYPAPQSAALPATPGAQHGASLGQPLVQMPAGAAPPSGGAASCKVGNPAGESVKVCGGFQLVPASDGQFAFLIPNAAFAPHGGAVIPLYTGGGLSSGPPAASISSRSAAPSLPADSLWRPW